MKKQIGAAPLQGIKYRFTIAPYWNNKTFLILVLGVDAQKNLKIKKGDRLLVEYDKKNPFLITISKTKLKAQGKKDVYTLMQPKSAVSVLMRAQWKFKKPAAKLCKTRMDAKYKILKSGKLKIKLI